MGVELRSMQRKFHSMMGEMKPQIRPRFVVWLDERLAEFKVKGRMELSETLEDPQWIKDFYMSKRESKAAAIKEREARDAGSSTGSVHPKIETKSESSNGVAHPEDLEGEKEEKQEDYDTGQRVEEQGAEASQPEQGFQLVEVKREQIEEDDDDDMIIVGETIAPQRQQVSYPSQYNPTRQMYSGFGRSVGPFQRKRQRFGSIPQRPSMTMSSGNRFKSRFKQNFRSAPLSSTANTSFPSHSATSQSLYTSSPSSQSYHTEAPSYADDPQEMYEGGDTHVYASETSQYSGESLRIPPHLQAQAAAELQTGEEDYEVTEGDMYADYGDESYDSSYLADATDSSLIQYDEQGNAVIKGENLGGDPSMEPMPGTSSDATSQDLVETWFFDSKGCNETSANPLACHKCGKTFHIPSSLIRHIKIIHLNISKYNCGVCGKPFATADHLDGHMNSVHYNRRPHVCECGQAFRSKCNLRTHRVKSCPIKTLVP